MKNDDDVLEVLGLLGAELRRLRTENQALRGTLEVATQALKMLGVPDGTPLDKLLDMAKVLSVTR